MSEEDQTNKVATAAGVSSRGRILKRPGISEKKLAALDKLRDVQSGNVRPLDQYKVSIDFQAQLYRASLRLFANSDLNARFQYRHPRK